MMRSPGWWALAVRKQDGGIHTEAHETAAYAKKRPILGRPGLRGIIALGESLAIGMRAMSISARVSAGEDDAPSKKEMGIAIAVALLFFVAVFIALPAILTRGAGTHTGWALVGRNLIEGLVRIGIFLAYILLISLMPDIRRVFQYHGAEHKVIAAHESGAPPTAQAARGFSTVHVRCGTDFLFIVMIMAVLIFSLAGAGPVWWRILSRVVLLPVVAALSYELLRLSARHERNLAIRVLTAPGRLLQRVTTREPDDDQLDVALAAMLELMRREGITPPGGDAPAPEAA